MTFEIPQELWAEFFSDLSKRRFGWETKVEVISKTIGDQIMSDGLPLNGMTFADKGGRRSIEIAVGDADGHQTHTIINPKAVSYLGDERGYGGIVEIEEENGTQTMIRLLNPMPIYVGYTSYKIVAAT